MPGLCNPGIDFPCRQVSSLAGLCSLRHFYLNLLCTYQITAGNAKTPGCHLFDRGTAVHSTSRTVQTLITLSALTGVGFAMQHIHGNSKSLMCLLGNRSIGHCTCLKAFYDIVNTFHFLKGNSLFRIPKVHQTPQISALFPVYQFRILSEHFVITAFCGFLQHMNGLGIIAVLLPLTPHLMDSHALQLQIRWQSQRVKRFGMAHLHIICNILQRDSAHAAHSPCKILPDHFL